MCGAGHPLVNRHSGLWVIIKITQDDTHPNANVLSAGVAAIGHAKGRPYDFMILQIIINADEEQSVQVARFISEVIGLAERQLNQVYGEVEAVRLWR